MTPQLLTFEASSQDLTKATGTGEVIAGRENHAEALFNLGFGWQDFEDVTAIWYKTPGDPAPVKLINNRCNIPDALLSEPGKLRVKLTGEIKVFSRTYRRLTTYPVTALVVRADREKQ